MIQKLLLSVLDVLSVPYLQRDKSIMSSTLNSSGNLSHVNALKPYSTFAQGIHGTFVYILVTFVFVAINISYVGIPVTCFNNVDETMTFFDLPK